MHGVASRTTGGLGRAILRSAFVFAALLSFHSTAAAQTSPPLPTVQFSASYSVSENGTAVTITVTLSAPSAASVTVNYATSDGTATAPADYISKSDMLTFAPGDTSETFQVTITDDLIPEQTESFSVQLSQPVNATLGTQGSATVTILDNDAWPTLTLIAHRTGTNVGTAISQAVKEEGNPQKYIVLTNNDYEQGLPNGARDYDDSVAVSGDDDLAKITLTRMSPALPQGTLKIEISAPVRVFKADGTVLSPAEWEVNLASPTGYLAGLTSGDVDIRLEGLSPDPDCVVAYVYCDASGTERSRDEVHMLLAEYSLTTSSGHQILPLVPAETLRYQSGIIPMPTVVGGKPSWNDVGTINSQASFKIGVNGLPTSAVASVEVRSNSGADAFTDQCSSGASYLSTNAACIYEGTGTQSLARTAETSTILSTIGLNVVQGTTATATLTTLMDAFTRKIETMRILPQPSQEPVGGRILVDYDPASATTFNAGASLSGGTYSWSILSQPDGATPSPSGGVGASFAFTTNKEGYYVVRLTYTFGGHATSTTLLAQVFQSLPPNPDARPD